MIIINHSDISSIWNQFRQHEATTILMIGEQELQYFPETLGAILKLEELQIKITCEHLEHQFNGVVIVRELRIDYSDNSIQKCRHYQHIGWPDLRIPTSVDSVVWIMNELRGQVYLMSCSPAHCGVGCVAFINQAALSFASRQNSLPEMLRLTREQHPGAVQTYEQLVFCLMVAIKIVVKDGAPGPATRRMLERLQDMAQQYQDQYQDQHPDIVDQMVDEFQRLL